MREVKRFCFHVILEKTEDLVSIFLYYKTLSHYINYEGIHVKYIAKIISQDCEDNFHLGGYFMNRKRVPSYSIFLPKWILCVLSFAAKLQSPKVNCPEVLWYARSSYLDIPFD